MNFYSEPKVFSFMDSYAVRIAVGCTPPHEVRFVLTICGVRFPHDGTTFLEFCLQVLHLDLKVDNFIGESRDVCVLCGEMIIILCEFYCAGIFGVGVVCLHHPILCSCM